MMSQQQLPYALQRHTVVVVVVVCVFVCVCVCVCVCVSTENFQISLFSESARN